MGKEIPEGKWGGKNIKKIMPVIISGLCITLPKKKKKQEEILPFKLTDFEHKMRQPRIMPFPWGTNNQESLKR